MKEPEVCMTVLHAWGYIQRLQERARRRVFTSAHTFPQEENCPCLSSHGKFRTALNNNHIAP